MWPLLCIRSVSEATRLCAHRGCFLVLSPHSFSGRKHTIGLSLSCLRSALLTTLAVVWGKSTRALVTLCQQEATIQVQQRRMTVQISYRRLAAVFKRAFSWPTTSWFCLKSWNWVFHRFKLKNGTQFVMVIRSCGFSFIAFASTVHANSVCVRVKLILTWLWHCSTYNRSPPNKPECKMSVGRRRIDGRSEQYELKFKTCVSKGGSVPQVPGSILYTTHLAFMVQK